MKIAAVYKNTITKQLKQLGKTSGNTIIPAPQSYYRCVVLSSFVKTAVSEAESTTVGTLIVATTLFIYN